MTIIMKASWNGLEQGTVHTLGATEEARLIAAGIAAAHTDGPSTRLRGDAVVMDDGSIRVRDDAGGGGGQVVGGGVPYPTSARVVGPIARLADYPPLASWMWSHLVDTQRTPVANPLARYYHYVTTDHGTRGGVRLFLSNSLEEKPELYQPGYDPLAPDIIYEDIDQPTTSPVSSSTETASIEYDPSIGKLRMFYQVIGGMFGNGTGAKANPTDESGGRTGGAGCIAGQVTLSATSADGRRWTKDRNFKIDGSAGNACFGGFNHTGYFLPSVLSDGRVVGYHIGAGTDSGMRFISRIRKAGDLGEWITSVHPLPRYSDLLADAGRVNEMVSWAHCKVIETASGLALLGKSTDITSGFNVQTGCLFVAPLADDCRTITGPITVLHEPQEAWEDNQGAVHVGWIKDGAGWAGTFVTMGDTKSMGVIYVR